MLFIFVIFQFLIVFEGASLYWTSNIQKQNFEWYRNIYSALVRLLRTVDDIFECFSFVDLFDMWNIFLFLNFWFQTKVQKIVFFVRLKAIFSSMKIFLWGLYLNCCVQYKNSNFFTKILFGVFAKIYKSHSFRRSKVKKPIKIGRRIKNLKEKIFIMGFFRMPLDPVPEVLNLKG